MDDILLLRCLTFLTNSLVDSVGHALCLFLCLETDRPFFLSLVYRRTKSVVEWIAVRGPPGHSRCARWSTRWECWVRSVGEDINDHEKLPDWVGMVITWGVMLWTHNRRCLSLGQTQDYKELRLPTRCALSGTKMKSEGLTG